MRQSRNERKRNLRFFAFVRVPLRPLRFFYPILLYLLDILFEEPTRLFQRLVNDVSILLIRNSSLTSPRFVFFNYSISSCKLYLTVWSCVVPVLTYLVVLVVEEELNACLVETRYAGRTRTKEEEHVVRGALRRTEGFLFLN